MAEIELFRDITEYSIEILLLAAGVCIITGLLKKAIPPAYKKYITFLPFAIGCAAYAVLLLISKKDPFTPLTVEKGFETGALSTIYYIIYEQFIRGKASVKGIRRLAAEGLLKGYVDESRVGEIAEKITAAADCAQSETGLKAACKDILTGNTLNDITPDDIFLLSQFLAKTLYNLK
ncbi:MAG: hypothetical protein PHN35_06475 [Clostridia bacterium]|nr:hypothetical protein [Clostridia bacterium]